MIVLLCSTTPLLSQEDGTELGSHPSDRREQGSIVYIDDMMGVMDIGNREFLLHHVPKGCELMAMRLIIAGIDWKSPHMTEIMLLCRDLSDLASKRFKNFYLLARMTGEDPLQQILPRHSVYLATVSSDTWIPVCTEVSLSEGLALAGVWASYVLFYETVRASAASALDYSLPPGAPGMIRHSGDIDGEVWQRGFAQAIEVRKRAKAENQTPR